MDVEFDLGDGEDERVRVGADVRLPCLDGAVGYWSCHGLDVVYEIWDFAQLVFEQGECH